MATNRFVDELENWSMSVRSNEDRNSEDEISDDEIGPDGDNAQIVGCGQCKICIILREFLLKLDREKAATTCNKYTQTNFPEIDWDEYFKSESTDSGKSAKISNDSKKKKKYQRENVNDVNRMYFSSDDEEEENVSALEKRNSNFGLENPVNFTDILALSEEIFEGRRFSDLLFEYVKHYVIKKSHDKENDIFKWQCSTNFDTAPQLTKKELKFCRKRFGTKFSSKKLIEIVENIFAEKNKEIENPENQMKFNENRPSTSKANRWEIDENRPGTSKNFEIDKNWNVKYSSTEIPVKNKTNSSENRAAVIARKSMTNLQRETMDVLEMIKRQNVKNVPQHLPNVENKQSAFSKFPKNQPKFTNFTANNCNKMNVTNATKIPIPSPAVSNNKFLNPRKLHSIMSNAPAIDSNGNEKNCPVKSPREIFGKSFSYGRNLPPAVIDRTPNGVPNLSFLSSANSPPKKLKIKLTRAELLRRQAVFEKHGV